MRKLILNLAITVDGYIEGPDGSFDWCFTDQDYGMKEFLSKTDAILFGRKTYEVLLKFDPHPYPDKKKYVVSGTRASFPDATVFRDEVKERIQALRHAEGKNVWLFGGAELTRFCFLENLIDEFHLAVHPILLGAGRPLFGGLVAPRPLMLLDTRTYTSGLVQLFLAPAAT